MSLELDLFSEDSENDSFIDDGYIFTTNGESSTADNRQSLTVCDGQSSTTYQGQSSTVDDGQPPAVCSGQPFSTYQGQSSNVDDGQSPTVVDTTIIEVSSKEPTTSDKLNSMDQTTIVFDFDLFSLLSSWGLGHYIVYFTGKNLYIFKHVNI